MEDEEKEEKSVLIAAFGEGNFSTLEAAAAVVVEGHGLLRRKL